MRAFRENEVLCGGKIVTVDAVSVCIGEKGVPRLGPRYVLVFHRAQIRRRGRPDEDHITTTSTDLIDSDLCSHKDRLDIFVLNRKWRKELMPDGPGVVAESSIVFEPVPDPGLSVRIQS
jgi:hypothetical protein